MGSVPTVGELVAGHLVARAEGLVTGVTWKWFLGEVVERGNGECLVGIGLRFQFEGVKLHPHVVKLLR